MRIALLIVVLAIAGCAKKQSAKPAAAPMENKATDSAPAGATGNGSPDDDKKDETKGDPCDGGEAKKK